MSWDCHSLKEGVGVAHDVVVTLAGDGDFWTRLVQFSVPAP
jgi:hypothetical protein